MVIADERIVTTNQTDVLHQLKTDTFTTEEALDICDSLPPISIDFMIGRWRGSEVRTEHRDIGALSATGWYGKLFIDQNNVHPLVFNTNGNQLFSMNPGRVGHYLSLGIDYDRFSNLKPLIQIMRPFVQTKRARARLRMTNYRDVISATMIYDQLPINDVFRKINDNAVLGIMDRRGDKIPYFFILERDDNSPLTLTF